MDGPHAQTRVYSGRALQVGVGRDEERAVVARHRTSGSVKLPRIALRPRHGRVFMSIAATVITG